MYGALFWSALCEKISEENWAALVSTFGAYETVIAFHTA